MEHIGKQVTIYSKSSFGVNKFEGKILEFGQQPYAQYPNATFVKFIPKGKRKPYGFIEELWPIFFGHKYLSIKRKILFLFKIMNLIQRLFKRKKVEQPNNSALNKHNVSNLVCSCHKPEFVKDRFIGIIFCNKCAKDKVRFS